MPFGLYNSPATFSRLMDQVLHGVLPTSCLKYLDDLIIHGRSFSEVLAHLEQVLQKLEMAGLKLNPKKCHLFQRQVDYLGCQHVISAEGVATDPKKIEAKEGGLSQPAKHMCGASWASALTTEDSCPRLPTWIDRYMS